MLNALSAKKHNFHFGALVVPDKVLGYIFFWVMYHHFMYVCTNALVIYNEILLYFAEIVSLKIIHVI